MKKLINLLSKSNKLTQLLRPQIKQKLQLVLEMSKMMIKEKIEEIEEEALEVDKEEKKEVEEEARNHLVVKEEEKVVIKMKTTGQLYEE